MSLISKTVLGTLRKRNAWAGAQVSRLNDFAFSWIQSASQELRGDIAMLRMRSRELARNNPNARRFLKMLEQNVVGHRGIRLEAQVTLKTGKNVEAPNEPVNDTIEEAWKDWGRRGNCEVTRKHSWVSFQHLVIKTVARDGEAFIRVVEGFQNDYGFALQLLDADQFDETYNVLGSNGTPRVAMGVEMDTYGAATGYWMWSQHPQDGNGMRERLRIPAKNILHLFLEERSGQARGVPWFAPVTIAMRMLDGYNEAELIAARTAAAKMGFIKPSPDAVGPDPDSPATQQVMEASPGSIERLGIGEDFQSWNPDHPAGSYAPFVLAQQRLLAMGLNVSYMGLTGDLTSANYSSARVGMLDERDGWRSLQTWLTDNLHDVVYRRWLRIAALTSKLRLPSADYAKYEDVIWRARGWAWVDPKNDTESAALAVDRGFESPFAIVAENGEELYDIYQDIAKANQMAKDLGIVLSTGVNPRPAVDKIAGETPPATPADPNADPNAPPNGKSNGRHAVLGPPTRPERWSSRGD